MIRNNLFYEMQAGWGIQTSSGARNWVIENNTFAYPNPAAEGQIMLWDGGHPNSVSDIVIRSNIFYQPRRFAIVTNGTVANCRIEQNVTTADGIIDRPARCNVSENLIRTDPRFVTNAKEPDEFRPGKDSLAFGHGWNPEPSSGKRDHAAQKTR